MIPLKIETLLEGRVVEHDRVEYNLKSILWTLKTY